MNEMNLTETIHWSAKATELPISDRWLSSIS